MDRRMLKRQNGVELSERSLNDPNGRVMTSYVISSQWTPREWIENNFETANARYLDEVERAKTEAIARGSR